MGWGYDDVLSVSDYQQNIGDFSVLVPQRRLKVGEALEPPNTHLLVGELFPYKALFGTQRSRSLFAC